MSYGDGRDGDGRNDHGNDGRDVDGHDDHGGDGRDHGVPYCDRDGRDVRDCDRRDRDGARSRRGASTFKASVA